MFVVKQIVWAKTKGYPWWPAEINKLPSSEHNYFKVTFVGQTNHALLEEKAVRKYQQHYDTLKTNNYKGLQHSIDLANREIEKRKTLIEESLNKAKNSKNPQKAKKIKKNNKSHKRKPKPKQKTNKTNKPTQRSNNQPDCQYKQEQQMKMDNLPKQQIPQKQKEAQQKSDLASDNLSYDCESPPAQLYELDHMRNVDRKKIQHTEEILFSFITKFNSNLWERQRQCLQAIEKIQAQQFKPEELLQSKITNMITHLHNKLTQKSVSALKKQQLQKISQINNRLKEKVVAYLFDCCYYDHFLKRMEKNVSIEKCDHTKKQIQPRNSSKKHRKYKRRQKLTQNRAISVSK